MNNIENFLNVCDDFISCKYLVAEYKLQKMLKALADSEEICSLVGECLEQYNRDREFAKTFVQDGHGDFVCVMPEEEYKIIALVFCTLVDIDNKKIDFTDFVKRFFGNNEESFALFIKTMVIPFRNLLAEAFGYPIIGKQQDEEKSEDSSEEENEDEEKEDSRDDGEDDVFTSAQKIAVQILSELQFAKQDRCVLSAIRICKAIVKTTSMQDEEILFGLVEALSAVKCKQIKFYVKELENLI